jgi:hypothetical protein
VPEPDDTPPKPAGAATQAEGQVVRWREVLDLVRGRADLTAKALGVIATTAITAIGINKIQDLSPTVWSGRTVFWAILAVLGFLLMAAVIAAFLGRLAKVNALVVTTTAETALEGLEAPEQALVKRVFDDTASLHQARSLRAYEARAARLDRIAARSAPPRREELQEAASVIRANVQAALGQAAADVVRRRSAQTFLGSWARTMYVCAVAGFLLFAIGTDYLAGDRDRSETVAKARLAGDKECAAVLKAYGELNRVVMFPADRRCLSTAPAAPSGATTPDGTITAVAGALEDLGTRLAACRAAVKVAGATRDPVQEQACDRIQALIATAASGLRADRP